MNIFIRGSLNIISNGTSSASNLLLQIALVNTVDGDTFGWLVIVLSTYFFALVVSRASTLEILLLTGRSREQPSTTWAFKRLAVFGAVALAAALGITVLAQVDTATTLPIVLVIPFLLFQDGFRYIMWSKAMNVHVAVIDSIWLLGTLIPLVFAYWTDQLSPFLATISWSIAGVISLLVGALLSIPKKSLPHPP